MRPYTPAAMRFLWSVIGGGAALTWLYLWGSGGTTPQWTSFGLLTLLGAAAHLYPVGSAQQKTRYVVTNTFIFGAVLLLDPMLVALHCVTVMLPFTLRKLRPPIWYGYAFHSVQTTVAALSAHAALALTGGPRFDSVTGLLMISAAAVLFPLLQAVLAGIMISLQNGVLLRQTIPLLPQALLAEAIQPFIGVVIAALWRSAPGVLAMLPVPVLAMYWLLQHVHLVRIVDVDTKTGLYTYSHFQQALAEELNRSRRVKRPLSVLFADMDYLRTVNNQWGHLAGDEVLKQVAEIAQQQVRPGDMVARFGGEEFVIMLPGTDLEEAFYLAEQVRSAVEEHPFAIGAGRCIRCTISVGVACSRLHGTDGNGLVEAADGALYQAKAQGRNRVARAPDPGARQEAAAPAPVQSAPASGVAVDTRSGRDWGSLLSALVLSVVIAGGASFLVFGALRSRAVPGSLLLGFVLFGALGELTRVQVYQGGLQKLTVTLSNVVILAAVGTGGLSTAVMSAFAGSLTHDFILRERRLPLEKRLFNFFNPVLSAGLAAGLYWLVAGEPGAAVSTIHLMAGALAAVMYYVSNTGAITVMISLRAGRSLAAVWQDHVWFAPPYIFLGLTGGFMGAALLAFGWMGALLFTVPVLLLRYTFSLYASKAESSIAALEAAKAEVEVAHAAQQKTVEELIETVAAIIDARDNSTYGHSRQVARYAVAIAREMGLSGPDVVTIRTAALLHDVGKVGVPEALLKKPSRLTDEEYAQIKEHAALGERIIGEVSALGEVARIVGEHHEKYDGSGYPAGKAAADITLGGRIVAAADALDSMLSDRPYSIGRPLEAVLAELERCTSRHFDPKVVEAVKALAGRLGPDAFINSARSTEEQSLADQVAM